MSSEKPSDSGWVEPRAGDGREDAGDGREDAGDGRGVSISLRGLSKSYAIYARPEDRLKQMLLPGRKLYREFSAVRDLDLTVYRGETFGIVGRNGSGKSTLLQMISGVLEPTSGELVVDGHVAPILALGIGFNPDFTGRENVFVNGAILGLSDVEISTRLDSIQDFAGIGEFFDQPVKTYSSGMYARLAFAVAINADPEILVIDEVLAVGDEAFTRKCFARIEELKRKGSTILFVSHSANLVIELCDRALLMDAGQRLLIDRPKTILSLYHRLVYATEARRSTIREEIRRLDQGHGPTLDEGVDADPQPDTTEPSQAANDTIIHWGHYDPDLRPESTVEYEPNGATICEPRILAPDGQRVNILLPGHVYTFTYDVLFDQPAHDVRFGMLIKLITGVELGGQSTHSAREAIPSVASGTVRVTFLFETRLTQGTYFLNAGVLGRQFGEERYLHRVLDAVMFRVDSHDDDLLTRHVDLKGGPARWQVVDVPGPATND